jgi:hypothetical protein
VQCSVIIISIIITCVSEVASVMTMGTPIRSANVWAKRVLPVPDMNMKVETKTRQCNKGQLLTFKSRPRVNECVRKAISACVHATLCVCAWVCIYMIV